MENFHGARKAPAGIPGLRNVDHIAYTVPDLRSAITFFRRVMGCELVYQAGPLFDREGDWMTRHVGVHARAELEMAMLRCGPTMNLELLEWSGSAPADALPVHGDATGQHLAFYVTDVAAAVDHLSAVPGVRVLGRPTMLTGTLDEGQWFVFFRAPWGMLLELVSRPAWLPYEAVTSHRLFGPAPGWDAR
jgi:catechol 2,3-dioxygenase-like lactoylglutathione lyase family enzyme